MEYDCIASYLPTWVFQCAADSPRLKSPTGLSILKDPDKDVVGTSSLNPGLNPLSDMF
jgi:hypothetical protein